MEEWRLIADMIVRAALDAADAGNAVRRAWTPLPDAPLLVLSIGKASIEMARAAEVLLGRREFEGIVTAIPERMGAAGMAPCADSAAVASGPAIAPRWRVFPCDHPLPTPRNIEAAAFIESRVRDFSASHRGRAQLVMLISGGGSAHLTLPDNTIPLGEYVELQRRLMRAGATIQELNAVRKHVERLKGGRLAELAQGLGIRVMLISDVIGDPLDVIASGPLAPDPTTFADAIGVLERHAQRSSCPAIEALLARGARGELHDTPKPGDAVFRNVEAQVIASNACAVDAVAAAMQSHFNEVRHQTSLTGEAKDVAGQLVDELAKAQTATRTPTCLVWGGEPTVSVGNSGGRGGPSQEIALAAAIELERRHMDNACVIAFSTDGIDGPTSNAGGIGDAALCRELRAHDPRAMLAAHDSATALELAARAIKTGPTGTNVNHIFVACSSV